MPIRSKKVLAAQLPSLSLVGAASAQGPPSADGDLPRVSNEKCRRWTIVGEPEVFFDFDPEAVRRMLRRVDARLIPLLFVIYLGCCVARVNIGRCLVVEGIRSGREPETGNADHIVLGMIKKQSNDRSKTRVD